MQKIYIDEYRPELLDLMAESGLTQTRLARAAGIARGTLSAWLIGANRVHPGQVDRLLDIAQELASRKAASNA
jgi:transcriptional regulator with XRE-family HTH domain